MILQITNIIAGFLLAAPELKHWGAQAAIERAERILGKYVRLIGIIELVLGMLALLERIGILTVHMPDFGVSYPQALAAIAIGLVLSAQYFKQYPVLAGLIDALRAHSSALGIIGILVGAGSLLFGCPLCF